MSGMFKSDSSKPGVKSSIGGKKSTKPKRAGLGGTKKVASNVNFEKLEQESTEKLKIISGFKSFTPIFGAFFAET